MKKIILSILVISISGCFNENTSNEESMHVNNFNKSQNIIRINGKSIASEAKIIDTGINIVNTKDNILWIQDKLLIANIEQLEKKGGLKSVSLENGHITNILEAPIDSVCIDDEKIKVKNAADPKSKSYTKLALELAEKGEVIVNGLKVEEAYHKINTKSKGGSKPDLKEETDILEKISSTGGCEEVYKYKNNPEIIEETTELVSYVSGVYPFVNIKVYHDNSPKKKDKTGIKFEEKDFSRTRVYFQTKNKEGVVQEKLYKMNLNIDYKINTEDYNNFSKIEGEIRGNSITTAFQVINEIKVLNFYRDNENLKPFKVETLNISKEKSRLLQDVKILKINKIRDGYLLTIKDADGLEKLLKHDKNDNTSFLLKGYEMSKEIKISNDLCKIALGHSFEKNKERTVKIINVCN